MTRTTNSLITFLITFSPSLVTPTSLSSQCPALSTFQMKLDLLSYEHDVGNYSPGEEPDNSFLSSIQEQRNQLNQMVCNKIIRVCLQDRAKI